MRPFPLDMYPDTPSRSWAKKKRKQTIENQQCNYNNNYSWAEGEERQLMLYTNLFPVVKKEVSNYTQHCYEQEDGYKVPRAVTFVLLWTGHRHDRHIRYSFYTFIITIAIISITIRTWLKIISISIRTWLKIITIWVALIIISCCVGEKK